MHLHCAGAGIISTKVFFYLIFFSLRCKQRQTNYFFLYFLPLYLQISSFFMVCYQHTVVLSLIFTNSALWAELVRESTCPSVCLMSPSHVIFFEASHLPSGHMIRSRPLIGPQVTWSDAIFLRGWTGAESASSVDWCDLDLE